MNSLKGHLLIASPEMESDFFARTVILMLDHGTEGALGVVLNRPMDATITDIAEQILDQPWEWDKPILVGGPVPGPIMILHREQQEGDEPVLPGLSRSIEAERVRALIRDRVEPSLIVANYSGWGPGQLEGEFHHDSWLTLPASPEHLFRDDVSDLWEEVVRTAHGRSLADFLGVREIPSDPSWN